MLFHYLWYTNGNEAGEKQKNMYHISRHYLGQNATFKPRIPVSQNEGETKLPARVCAAPSIDQCWEAINGCYDLIAEMRKQRVTGYYFFVYQFNDTSSFVPSESVKDYNKSGEMISVMPVEAELIDVFYVDSWRLYRGLGDVVLKDGSTKAGAKEPATFEEAINAYNDWQMSIMKEIEKKVYSEFWAAHKTK